MTAGFASAEASGAEFAAGGGRCIPYPAYKESGVEWLGLIPAHWDVRRLKYVAPLRESRFDAKREEDIYVGLENIESWTGRLQVDVQPESVESVVGRFEAGDVLFGKLRPNLAKAARPAFSGVSTSEVLALCPVECTQSYLLFSLLTDSFIRWFDAHTYGTRMPRVGPDQVGNSFISLPPSSEQRDIANFLDRETAKIDALLANKERLIELLQEKRTALITRTVTKGLDSDVPMKDAGVEWLGEVPAHWEVKRINQLSEILRGKFSHRPRNDPALYDGPYPFIQTGEVARARKEITSFRQTLNERGLNVSKLFPSGTLVMTIAANIGDVAVLDFSACFPDSVVGFVPRTGVERDFLFYGFLAMKPKLLREAPVNTQGNLNIQRIGSRENPMPVPSQSEQRAIADYLDRETMKIDALIAKVREAIDRLKELRAALISAAVTGKIDVRQTAARSR